MEFVCIRCKKVKDQAEAAINDNEGQICVECADVEMGRMPFSPDASCSNQTRPEEEITNP